MLSADNVDPAGRRVFRTKVPDMIEMAIFDSDPAEIVPAFAQHGAVPRLILVGKGAPQIGHADPLRHRQHPPDFSCDETTPSRRFLRRHQADDMKNGGDG